MYGHASLRVSGKKLLCMSWTKVCAQGFLKTAPLVGNKWTVGTREKEKNVKYRR